MIHDLVPSFTEAGKIKLGGLGEERTSRSGGKYRQPVKYDEFVITKTYRDAHGGLVEDESLMAALDKTDGKLREIPILLHSDELEEVFPSSYARYAGKKLHCTGDGRTATRFEFDSDKKRNGKTKQIQCPCQFLQDRSCKPHGTLHCSIRVEGLAVAGAIHMFRTTSIITIRRIVGSLTQIQKTTGVLQGLPLWLVVQPVVVNPDGASSSTVYCAHIELRAADVRSAQMVAIESARLRTQLAGEVASMNQRYRAMLKAPAADDEPESEQAAVAAEFHSNGPGNMQATPPPAVAKQERKQAIKERLNAAADKRNGVEPAKPPANPAGSDSWADVGPPPMTDADYEQFEQATKE